MSCQKYSGWLTDTALGELRAEREPELLAHVMECDACREALRGARAVHDFVDRGVESLVAGEPSPQFAANLRRRIAEESERSSWTPWAPVVAGALALAVVLAVMIARVPRHGVATPSSASSSKSIPAPSESVSASISSPQNGERTARKRDSNRGARERTAKAALPVIIVPKGQLVAAMQLSSSISSGRVDGNQLLVAQQEYTKPLEVKPIEIVPMEIPPLDAATETPANSIQF